MPKKAARRLPPASASASAMQLALILLLVASASLQCQARPNNEQLGKQINAVVRACSTRVCLGAQVKLTDEELNGKATLLRAIDDRTGSRSRGNSRGVCAAVVVVKKIDGLYGSQDSNERMQTAAIFAYNLYEYLNFAKPEGGGDCSRKIAVFYSIDDNTLYTFAAQGLLTSREIRTASAAARPYFASSIFEGMRALLLSYFDTIDTKK